MATKTTLDLTREAAEADLVKFIKLVAPHRVLGAIHEELCIWWTRSEAKSHQLVLMPRDHQKSAMMAYRVAWAITRNPATTILYISSTANLAEKQLKMVKDILTSKIYRRYWPDMVHTDEGKREKWTNSEIAVDHPKRKQEGVRDPTVFTAGLTTSITGLHCNVAVLDDVVVQENAYTEEGREKVKAQYSLLASIESADAQEWVVGTRYHPVDLFSDLLDMEIPIYDEEGEEVGAEHVYEAFIKVVEDEGNGRGEFLWPRMQRIDGTWFGFDARILAKKKAQYLDKTQFFAQYYNDPNAVENGVLDSSRFQYYEKNKVVRVGGRWQIAGEPMNVYAAIDFAYSVTKTSDYSCIVVIGVTAKGNIYVLDIYRFKTERISEMFEQIRNAHIKWDFRKLRAEMTAAQSTIVRELKEMYIRPEGLALSIDEYYPSRHEGSKEERINACLEPRYTNLSIWHYRGGNCSLLEEELLQAKPAHDDIKDALTAAINIAVVPKDNTKSNLGVARIAAHPRFGGVAA